MYELFNVCCMHFSLQCPGFRVLSQYGCYNELKIGKHFECCEIPLSFGRKTFLLTQILLSTRKQPAVLMPSFLSYTGCPGGNVPHFGRMFLTLKYTDITQNTYVYPKLNGYGDNGERSLKV